MCVCSWLHTHQAFIVFQPSTVRVRSLLAREKAGGGTKSLCVISSPPYSNNGNFTTNEEPEKYDIDIIQPPTRDDWISGIRYAVDSAPPGSDSEEEEVGPKLYKTHFDG